VRTRRAELVAAAKIDPEDIIFGEPRTGESEPVAAGEYLEGIAGSVGVVRGYARVVRDPSEVTDALGPEDLLVVPFMDIGWTPLFRGIGGIVAETGGQLSHSAIVAREYGIPAVVSVAGAMRLIQDGQPLTVDGTRGRVYLSHT
jgi:pyruvate,water dikinase